MVSSLRSLSRGDSLRSQIGEVRLAEGALDDLDMKRDVRGEVGGESFEQIAAKLLTAWAGQAAPTPDGPECVEPRIRPVVPNVLEPGPE